MPSAFLRVRVIVARPSPALMTERIEASPSALTGVDLLPLVSKTDARRCCAEGVNSFSAAALSPRRMAHPRRSHLLRGPLKSASVGIRSFGPREDKPGALFGLVAEGVAAGAPGGCRAPVLAGGAGA